MALLAGFFWGATTVVIKATNLRLAPPSQVLFYQLAVSALPLWVLVWLRNDTLGTDVSWLSWTSLAYQTIWVVSISYTIWFALIARYSATQISVFTFLTPLLGVIFGVVLLSETFGLPQWIGLVLVLIGIAVVTRPQTKKTRGSEASKPIDEIR